MTTKSVPAEGYRLYWLTWVILLALTLGMLVADSIAWPAWVLLGLLLVAMLVKAGFIVANFMHLRYERLGLVLMIVLGILATGAVLFFLIAIDAARILRLSSG
jgi:cytochrome c oxidase subunit 4